MIATNLLVTHINLGPYLLKLTTTSSHDLKPKLWRGFNTLRVTQLHTQLDIDTSMVSEASLHKRVELEKKKNGVKEMKNRPSADG